MKRLSNILLLLLIGASFMAYAMAAQRNASQDESAVHPPEMRCFPPRDMLDWRPYDPPSGMCPDWHHLDV